ncbi:MAG: NUDIX hydrolase [Caldilineaceae bacterium]|nr:NUDIX hydrolase [Caldilineaceae bacterium]MCB9138798.1 NUDIX hydrolase [Caldilineaceae bacterium]
MQPWKTLSREILLQPDSGRFLTVENHQVQLSDGSIIQNWPWLITPDFVNVVVETEEGDFLCFRQTKYAVDGVTLAIVGGYLEPGEDPLAAAQREVLEETGYVADEWSALGGYAIDGNRGCGNGHLFLARGARYVRPIDADDLEEQTLIRLNRDELRAALMQGKFRVMPWSTAVAMALLKMEAE